MCYSAQLHNASRKFVRHHGAEMDIHEFHKLYGWRYSGGKIYIPKSVDADFANPVTDEEREISAFIDGYNAQQVTKFEKDLFTQRKRLADAERTLQAKTTKAATESKRIATDKISKALFKLTDLRRKDVIDRDARFFPGWYAPVIISENGRLVVKPMRYQCRPAGKPANYDFKYPGTYNARRDNLEKFWKGQFGVTHGLMVVNAFYENVNRHRMEDRELRPGEEIENAMLEFRPEPQQDMLVACLWSHWTGTNEPDLLSFAAITDEPPAEVAAAGHDRCIIPIKPEHIDAWLNPDPKNLAAMYAILDDRERPYYEHRLAA